MIDYTLEPRRYAIRLAGNEVDTLEYFGGFWYWSDADDADGHDTAELAAAEWADWYVNDVSPALEWERLTMRLPKGAASWVETVGWRSTDLRWILRPTSEGVLDAVRWVVVDMYPPGEKFVEARGEAGSVDEAKLLAQQLARSEDLATAVA